MKIAILQVADTSPLESLVIMLQSVGYSCYLPNGPLKGTLRHLGCDTVVDVEGLVENWGYEKPFLLPQADAGMLKRCDLYVDVKAHRNGPRLWRYYPNLASRTLYYRVNGGQPEHVINARGDQGDEVDPPCPILTPNQWYADREHYLKQTLWKSPTPTEEECLGPAPWNNRAYCCWPPFHGIERYYRSTHLDNKAVCLVHNFQGWGYGKMIGPMRDMGILCYGRGSPDGLINHSVVPTVLSRALCMVHLKSNDAPGYALYEALASACPVVVSRRLIWRCNMQELLVPGETCLAFDRETHDELSDEDVLKCTHEITVAMGRLASPAYNRQIGEAGRQRLLKLMWSKDRQSDVDSLRMWMGRMFG